MMETRVYLLRAAAVGAFLVAVIGCASLLGDSDDDLLTDPSFHIMVSSEQAMTKMLMGSCMRDLLFW